MAHSKMSVQSQGHVRTPEVDLVAPVHHTHQTIATTDLEEDMVRGKDVHTRGHIAVVAVDRTPATHAHARGPTADHTADLLHAVGVAIGHHHDRVTVTAHTLIAHDHDHRHPGTHVLFNPNITAPELII